MELNVNSLAIGRYSEDLRRIRTSLLPKAIRNTLNDVAFNTRRRVPDVASREFTVRNKSLFRTFILVNKTAAGDINSMKTEVGIFDKHEKTAEGLEKQEIGGVTERPFIPLDQARISNSNSKRVRKANYLDNIRLPQGRGRGTGTGYVMIKKGDTGTVFQSRQGKKGQKLKPLYSFGKRRRVSIAKRPFIRTSAIIESRKIEEIYRRNAIKLIQNNLRRR